MDTEIEGRFGILEPIRWPFRYSLDNSVAVSVFSGRFGGHFGILGSIRYSYVPREMLKVTKCIRVNSFVGALIIMVCDIKFTSGSKKNCVKIPCLPTFH